MILIESGLIDIMIDKKSQQWTFNRIVPLSDTTKSLHAGCRPKASIRQNIWDEAKERSGLDVPPVQLLKDILAEHKKAKGNHVDSFFAKLTTDKSQDEILNIYDKVLNRIKTIENDEYKVEEIGVTELKRLKVSLDAYLVEHVVYQNI